MMNSPCDVISKEQLATYIWKASIATSALMTTPPSSTASTESSKSSVAIADGVVPVTSVKNPASSLLVVDTALGCRPWFRSSFSSFDMASMRLQEKKPRERDELVDDSQHEISCIIPYFLAGVRRKDGSTVHCRSLAWHLLQGFGKRSRESQRNYWHILAWHSAIRASRVDGLNTL